jgi:SAM-dependent methyltransferase
MSRCEFPEDSFAGVAAFYSFLHLPHGELPDLLRRIGRWLRPDGLLVATMATRPDAGTVEPDWLGVPMYFSGYAAEDSRRFLIEAGLEIETFLYESILEQGRPTRFLWVVARKPHGS